MCIWSSCWEFSWIPSSPKRNRGGLKEKSKTIALANAPQNKKELQKFLSRVNYLRRFISNLSGKTKEFSDFVKLKDMEEFRWVEQHQAAFDKIKEFLSKPLVLMPPIKLYLSFENE